jgi:hypothetical protein
MAALPFSPGSEFTGHCNARASFHTRSRPAMMHDRVRRQLVNGHDHIFGPVLS